MKNKLSLQNWTAGIIFYTLIASLSILITILWNVSVGTTSSFFVYLLGITLIIFLSGFLAARIMSKCFLLRHGAKSTIFMFAGILMLLTPVILNPHGFKIYYMLINYFVTYFVIKKFLVEDDVLNPSSNVHQPKSG